MEIKVRQVPIARAPVSKAQLAFAALLLGLLGLTGCGKDASQTGELTLPELNRAAKMWNMTRGTYPQDVAELTNFPALQGRAFPKIPAGKKLVLDPKSHEVVIVDQ